MSRFLRVVVLTMLLIVFAAMGTTTLAARPDLRARLEQLGATQCPDSDFTCVTLTVPLDHFNPADTRTLDVVFAILPASGARKGMFVTATGGPGTSGIYYADSYATYHTPELPEKFDLVFFDQRGIGLSGGMDCYQAASGYYQADWRADTHKREQKLRVAAKKFADDCDAEMGHPEFLPYLSTAQAVEDLEMFRQAMGDEKFWLYGESYGTQYAQYYAHAHGDHLAAMILDGTVDLTLDGIPYYAAAAQSFNDTLVASLEACKSAAKCAADFGQDPVRVYDRLAKKLQAQRKTVWFPLGDGSRVQRKFGFGDLESTGVGQMYGQSGRMLFVRALAAFARDGDLVPLTRLLYPNLGIDEKTLEPSYDPSWSDAYYYGVECKDYGYFSGDAETRADQYVVDALPVELSKLRLTSLIWGDLPCVYWRDSAQAIPRPQHWDAAGVPTLVLNALADPITPLGSARAVYEHLDDGYLITQRGGPHVIFERGVACIDDLVNEFLLNDTKPAQRETECNGRVMSKYVPLAPRDARAFKNLLEAMESAETEIMYLPEFYDWDYATTTRAGCAVNGWLRFKAFSNRAEFKFDNCAFSKGLYMTGRGKYNFNQDTFSLNVTVTGYHNCKLNYKREGAETSLKRACGEERGTEERTLGAQERFEPKERGVNWNARVNK